MSAEPPIADVNGQGGELYTYNSWSVAQKALATTTVEVDGEPAEELPSDFICSSSQPLRFTFRFTLRFTVRYALAVHKFGPHLWNVG